ncbi:MAG: CapA family protein [Atopobiaceae bacterium]|nr:CapA family protein [Atopobiaceae bacterium]MCH4179856.1 CapA family protein [Atopobiaceae bacterium]MCH4213607.1 CapA family protein [Atopobiaceae bacterium]MCH4276255.1 CapA family protein [Atopobiaceae bacterium]MCI1226024.1 CapA family protein [Atopobiaceae bacterium]
MPHDHAGLSGGCRAPVTRRGFLAATAAGLLGLASAGCASTASSVPAASPGRETVYDAVQPAVTSTSTSIDLMMVGDVLVHQGVWQSGLQGDGSYNFDHLFAHMADDAAAADIALVNQETILGGTQMGLSTYPSFNSPQEIGDAEAAIGITHVTCASNHCLDMGYAGIQSELDFWHASHPEVTPLGIAESQEAHDAITVFEKDGFKVALLNYTYGTNVGSLPSEAPWCCDILDEPTVTQGVADAREQADLVVLMPHWGTEYDLGSDDYQRGWAQTLCDAGVDVVIGTHPHVIEPVEVMAGADGHKMLVFWSLGNFVSCQAEAARMVGGMAKVSMVKDSSGARVSSYEFDPLVDQKVSGTAAMTTYHLAEYTDELASQNGILSQDPTFSLQYCKDLCAQVLGSGFDAEACVLKGTV